MWPDPAGPPLTYADRYITAPPARIPGGLFLPLIGARLNQPLRHRGPGTRRPQAKSSESPPHYRHLRRRARTRAKNRPPCANAAVLHSRREAAAGYGAPEQSLRRRASLRASITIAARIARDRHCSTHATSELQRNRSIHQSRRTGIGNDVTTVRRLEISTGTHVFGGVVLLVRGIEHLYREVRALHSRH